MFILLHDLCNYLEKFKYESALQKLVIILITKRDITIANNWLL